MTSLLPASPEARRAVEICACLRKAGHRALLAGGCVRDCILGDVPRDYDIATSASPAEVSTLFPHTYMVGAQFGVCVICAEEGNFEVAQFRSDGPYSDGRRPDYVTFTDDRQDALRRDFTINALFMEPENGGIIDHVRGLVDLESGILRTVGNPGERFREDHLRLLRAIRFAARYDYRIEENTWIEIAKHAPLVKSTSAERLRDELTKILVEGHAATALILLRESGLLEQVLPEVAAMIDVEQPPEFHPEGDVFTHTQIMLKMMPIKPSPTLAWSVLLHDVGKPVTQTFEDRIRFNLHDKAGAHLARRICERFRFSNEDTDRVVTLVENHMRLEGLSEMREARRIRFLKEPYVPELLALCRLDCMSSHGDTRTVGWAEELREEILAASPPIKPLLNGHDLMQMGYKPGPVFRDILESMLDAQLEREILNPEAAREWVLKRWAPGSEQS